MDARRSDGVHAHAVLLVGQESRHRHLVGLREDHVEVEDDAGVGSFAERSDSMVTK